MSPAERRDRNEEQADELYGQLFCEEEDRQRTEWEAEFDVIPFKADGARIHRVVMQQMKTNS